MVYDCGQEHWHNSWIYLILNCIWKNVVAEIMLVQGIIIFPFILYHWIDKYDLMVSMHNFKIVWSHCKCEMKMYVHNNQKNIWMCEECIAVKRVLNMEVV